MHLKLTSRHPLFQLWNDESLDFFMWGVFLSQTSACSENLSFSTHNIFCINYMWLVNSCFSLWKASCPWHQMNQEPTAGLENANKTPRSFSCIRNPFMGWWLSGQIQLRLHKWLNLVNKVPVLVLHHPLCRSLFSQDFKFTSLIPSLLEWELASSTGSMSTQRLQKRGLGETSNSSTHAALGGELFYPCHIPAALTRASVRGTADNPFTHPWPSQLSNF